MSEIFEVFMKSFGVVFGVLNPIHLDGVIIPSEVISSLCHQMLSSRFLFPESQTHSQCRSQEGGGGGGGPAGGGAPPQKGREGGGGGKGVGPGGRRIIKKKKDGVG